MASIRQAWGNPLARPADRVEAAVRLTLSIIFLCTLPFLAVLGSHVWQAVSTIVQHQQQSRQQTTAQLLADVPELAYDDQGSLMAEQVWVGARWVAPDGAERTGSVAAVGGERSGQRIEIWVDQAGDVSNPPVDPAAVAVLIITVTLVGALMWAGLLMAAHYTVRGRLDRRRIAGWDVEWRRIEPLWSGRSRGGTAQP